MFEYSLEEWFAYMVILKKSLEQKRRNLNSRRTENLPEQGALERTPKGARARVKIQIQCSGNQGRARAGPGSARAGRARVFDVKEVFLAVSSVVT